MTDRTMTNPDNWEDPRSRCYLTLEAAMVHARSSPWTTACGIYIWDIEHTRIYSPRAATCLRCIAWVRT